MNKHRLAFIPFVGFALACIKHRRACREHALACDAHSTDPTRANYQVTLDKYHVVCEAFTDAMIGCLSTVVALAIMSAIINIVSIIISGGSHVS